MLHTETMLVWVQETMGVPNALDPCGDHSSPHFADYFKQRVGADHTQIMNARLLGEEGHQAIAIGIGHAEDGSALLDMHPLHDTICPSVLPRGVERVPSYGICAIIIELCQCRHAVQP